MGLSDVSSSTKTPLGREEVQGQPDYEAIVVGAGVVGPAVAVGLARQGRKVLLIEKDWRAPERIVGELMQPAGLRALRSLGMIQAINNIDAIPETGYTVIYQNQQVSIPYPYKSEVGSVKPIESCVFDGNDKVIDDATLSRKDFEEDESERGVSFEHGKFIGNLRRIAQNEKNITCLTGTVTDVLKDGAEIIGVKVTEQNDVEKNYTADITIICDGIFSKLRRLLFENTTAVVNSHFIALKLKNAELPVKNTGNVILGTEFAPILVYQISPDYTRVLCAYNNAKLPRDLKGFLRESVLPNLPRKLQPSFKNALEEDVIKSMPNSYLPAKINDKPGLLVLGDALNMRHPLTGGGMTVGLNDAAIIVRELGKIEDLSSKQNVLKVTMGFHHQRMGLSVVINVLSVALYALFSADNSNLKILQRGCFKYFQRGGDCVALPVGFLSGLIPKPALLAWVFFKVAFYSIYVNFFDNGILYLPLSIIQIFTVLFTAIRVFTPYLFSEAEIFG